MKDRNYLQKGYTLKNKFRRLIINDDVDDKRNATAGTCLEDSHDFYLIKHLYTDIFECGKHLTVLRLCNTKVCVCALPVFLNKQKHALYIY